MDRNGYLAPGGVAPGPLAPAQMAPGGLAPPPLAPGPICNFFFTMGAPGPICNFFYKWVLAPGGWRQAPWRHLGRRQGAWRHPPWRQVPPPYISSPLPLGAHLSPHKSRKKRERRGEAKQRSSAGFSRDLQVNIVFSVA
jgi:hypothetical protein